MALETEMRGASEALGVASSHAVDTAAVPATLGDGRVVSTKEDLALVVVNLGKRHGVTVGMPFQVQRDNQPIGTVRVVDVREQIAGAVIQNLSSEKERIKTGDRLKVDARR